MVSVRSRPSLGNREPLAPSIAGRLRPHRRPNCPPGLRQQPPCCFAAPSVKREAAAPLSASLAARLMSLF